MTFHERIQKTIKHYKRYNELPRSKLRGIQDGKERSKLSGI